MSRYGLVPRVLNRSALKDCGETEGNQSATYLNDKYPADNSKLFLRKDVEVQEEKR